MKLMELILLLQILLLVHPPAVQLLDLIMIEDHPEETPRGEKRIYGPEAAGANALADVRGVPALLDLARQLNPALRCAVLAHTDEEEKWLASSGVSHVLRSQRALAEALARVVAQPQPQAAPAH